MSFFLSLLLSHNLHPVDAFIFPAAKPVATFVLASSPTDGNDLSSVANMRVKEIKGELQDLNIDFSDCFDKESLVSRLQDAREGKVKPIPKEKETAKTDDSDDSAASSSETPTAATSVEEPPKDEETAVTTDDGEATTFDKEAALEELRSMKVRDLREELGRRQISRAGLFEKEDLVQALLKGREQASKFSATGVLQPGQVADLTGEQLLKEMQHPTPMLLDVYAVGSSTLVWLLHSLLLSGAHYDETLSAIFCCCGYVGFLRSQTWCGPCKMMVPILQETALDLGSKVRVVKMDSDKYPQEASQLRVQGLPTLVLFNNGQELDRIEGAPPKEQLMAWLNSKL